MIDLSRWDAFCPPAWVAGTAKLWRGFSPLSSKYCLVIQSAFNAQYYSLLVFSLSFFAALAILAFHVCGTAKSASLLHAAAWPPPIRAAAQAKQKGPSSYNEGPLHPPVSNRGGFRLYFLSALGALASSLGVSALGAAAASGALGASVFSAPAVGAGAAAAGSCEATD